MAEQEPGLGLHYGWQTGESGWGEQMDANLQTVGAAAAGRLTVELTTDADYTLDTTATPAEHRHAFITITDPGDVLTAPRAIIFPAEPAPATLLANATAQPLTARVAGGSGVEVPPGERAYIYYDGEDMARMPGGEGGGGGPSTLGGLSDVDVTGAADGDALTYDSDNGRWVPGASGASAGVYDVLLGFVGTPDASVLDWMLVGRAATIAASAPGEAYARTLPADGDWTATLRKNGSSVGSVTISTAGAVSWGVSSDIVVAPGDRLELLAPGTADSALADIQVLLRGSV